MIEVRTWQDFVDDMITDGRSVRKIRMVAFNTRWRPFLSEIIDYARKLKKIIKFSNKRLKSNKNYNSINEVPCWNCGKTNCKGKKRQTTNTNQK